jgi:hypothetical protein
MCGGLTADQCLDMDTMLRLELRGVYISFDEDEAACVVRDVVRHYAEGWGVDSSIVLVCTDTYADTSQLAHKFGVTQQQMMLSPVVLVQQPSPRNGIMHWLGAVSGGVDKPSLQRSMLQYMVHPFGVAVMIGADALQSSYTVNAWRSLFYSLQALQRQMARQHNAVPRLNTWLTIRARDALEHQVVKQVFDIKPRCESWCIRFRALAVVLQSRGQPGPLPVASRPALHNVRARA